MARFSLHAVGQDRPGIVAAVTQALADLGCNLAESRMAILHGQFAIVLVLEAPGVSSGVAIEEALTPAIEELGLQLLIRPIPDDARHPDLGGLVGISIRGADRPGTVARVARAVAEAGGNVVDLVGHVAGSTSAEPSLLELVVALEDPAALRGLEEELISLAAQLEMRCEVREHVARPT
ncbi:MAG TPA: ACT domain-containing protein [Acidimicrobiales bacterium]|nr:ACT domain-containing protein [Acidimicrobiales bacterium]